MKPRIKRWLFIGTGSVAVLIVSSAWLVTSLNRSSAISATLRWARLDPFPVQSAQLKVKSTGSMFSREIEISFKGDPKLIEEWIHTSPGTKAIVPEKDSNGWWLYTISPGGGAVHAELRLSPDKAYARVRAVWS